MRSVEDCAARWANMRVALCPWPPSCRLTVSFRSLFKVVMWRQRTFNRIVYLLTTKVTWDFSDTCWRRKFIFYVFDIFVVVNIVSLLQFSPPCPRFGACRPSSFKENRFIDAGNLQHTKETLSGVFALRREHQSPLLLVNAFVWRYDANVNIRVIQFQTRSVYLKDLLVIAMVFQCYSLSEISFSKASPDIYHVTSKAHRPDAL